MGVLKEGEEREDGRAKSRGAQIGASGAGEQEEEGCPDYMHT